MVMSSLAELFEYFRDKLDDSLALLQRLIGIESHSRDKQGVDTLAEFLAKEFQKRGAEVELLPDATRGNGLKAVWRSGIEGKPVLLLGHLDTVWPPGTVAARPFSVQEGKAYGPGTYDMKAGILLCLLVCQALNEKKLDPGKDVAFFFTPDEEIGSAAGLRHLKPVTTSCRAVLCMEPPLSGGGAKTFRKGVGTFRLRVEGISAHAGGDHAKGANAIVELCRLVVQIQEMTDYARGITASVGTITGGTASNVIPAEASAEVDCRVCTVEDWQRMEERIRSLRPLDPRCTLYVEGGMNRPPLERTEAVLSLYQKAKAVAAELGLDLTEGSSGGGSDGSFTAAMGIPTLDGLGIEGDGAHAVHEWIDIGNIPQRAALICGLIRAIED